MASLTKKEVLLVQKFRNRVTDVVPQENLQNDYWLIRWLRARDFDMEKAEFMLRRSMGWFRRNEMESVLDWKAIHNYFRYAVLGTDKSGCPVFIIPMGLWDMREVVEMGDIVPAFRSVLRLLATMELEIKTSSKWLDKPVNQIILIFDFQKFSYRQLNNRTVVQGAVEFFRIFEANHPEILKHCYFINTPRIFPLFFAILKPFLSTKTLSKMEFYGPQKDKWIRVLLENIPAEILPPHFGGTRPGTDEYCSMEDIWNEGPLPFNFYETDMSRGRNSIVDLTFGDGDKQSGENRKSLTLENGSVMSFTMKEIPAGSKLQVEFPVGRQRFEGPEPPTILLKWRLRSDAYDIGFEVTFKDEMAKTTEVLIENHRVESHLAQQEGSIVCENPGTYIVTFDNSFSKRRKKIIYYSLVIEELELA